MKKKGVKRGEKKQHMQTDGAVGNRLEPNNCGFDLVWLSININI